MEVTPRDQVSPGSCRACRAERGPEDTVLDLGEVPAADHFPLPGDPGPDPVYALAMWLCPRCGLAQLDRDDTTADEPRAVEPEALRRQARDGVERVLAWLPEPARSGSVAEFGSPHGGEWLPLFVEQGFTPTAGTVDLADGPDGADVVVDSFGLMHEPDQRVAVRRRAEALAEDGVLLVLFHSLEAILRQGQWSALRHGHYGYYSATALAALLDGAGLAPVASWDFELYGGTVLLAVRHHAAAERLGVSPSWPALLEREAAAGLTDPRVVRRLQEAADREPDALRASLAGSGWYAYGAASRAVAVLARSGIGPDQLLAVADASPGKQGRAMPGSRVPIISPEELVAAAPDKVWLLLPDLLDEVGAAWPTLRPALRV